MIRQVVVAMPNPAERRRLAALVATLPGFVVCAATASLMETYSEVEERSPCVVLVASSFAVLPEYEVMQGLFSTLDIRWLTVRESASHDIGPPPGQPHGADLFAVAPDVDAETLGAKLLCITRAACRDRAGVPALGALPAKAAQAAGPGRVILIGASTGGIDALLAVLSTFDADCPAMVIVQHTGHGFGDSLAALLDRKRGASRASGLRWGSPRHWYGTPLRRRRTASMPRDGPAAHAAVRFVRDRIRPLPVG